MSYNKAMKQKVIKRNKSGEHLYVGFGSSKPKQKTEQEIREFHRTDYIAFHTKRGTKDISTEDDYVKTILKQQELDLIKWNN